MLLLDAGGAARSASVMCNDYGNRIPYSEYVDEFSQIKLPLIIPEGRGIPNLEPREDIRPTDPAPIIRRVEGGVELAQLRWGFPPGRPKVPPVINFRSEGRRFGKGRCLVPASHFFEFTGTKYPKTKWRFTMTGEPWFCFAGLWRETPETEDGARFTILTTAPGPDVAPYHDRQVVVLPRADWAAWLDLTRPEAELLRPLAAGSLEVEQVQREA
jgi:putative SOS response-associated peptidase YedK